MLPVGIDKIGFYTPRYFLDLTTLADARDVDVKKFHVGLGQSKMSIAPPDEDIITMAANAAQNILAAEDIDHINTLIFATESGLDYSKAAGIYVHKLLELSPYCRTIEVKQACYSATAAVQMALAMLHCNPNKKILVIAADVAYYGFNNAGESSQGAGATAMLLSVNPRLLAIEPESGLYTEEAADFWRPNYCAEPIVNGKYSCELYLQVLEKTWQQYSILSGRQFSDHDYFCYHVSIPKLVEKAHKRLAQLYGPKNHDWQQSQQNLTYTLNYGRETGNCYTAALFISLLSLLETVDKNMAGSRIGLYSYGSGCVGEFFSGMVQPGYRDILQPEYHQKLLADRQELSYAEYENFCSFKLPTDGSNLAIPQHKTGKFRLAAIDKHKRRYEQIT